MRSMASGSTSEITILHSNSGSRFTISCSLTETVSRLKELIRDARGISPSCQRLIFCGKDITNMDGETLRRVGCVGIGAANPFVHLIERVRTVVDLTACGPAGKENCASSAATTSSSNAVVSITIDDDDSDEDDCFIVGVTKQCQEIVDVDALPEGHVPQISTRRTPSSSTHDRPSCAFPASLGQSSSADLTDAPSSTCRNVSASSSPLGEGQSDENVKKRRRSGAEKAAPKEKRRARFRSACPYIVQQRIERAVSQRLYLVSRSSPTTTDGEISESFTVLGSTGNLYDVTVGAVPCCSCPDYSKGNLCKHILFVLLKVLRVPAQSHTIYQKALLQSELKEILCSEVAKRPCGGVLANSHVRQTYKQLHGKSGTDNHSDGASTEQQQRPIEDGAECPICFEEIAVDGEKLVFCRAECGRSLHADCFERWAKQKRANRVAVTCIFCRSPWLEEATPALASKGKGKSKGRASGGSTGMSEGYVNLGQLQGQSQIRDTSTYQRYWYEN